MSQHLVSMTVSNDDVTAVDAALTVLETRLPGMVDLTVAQRRSASKMGPKSEAFCRQTINTLDLNPKIVPPGIDLPEAKANLIALDQLRPRFLRLRRLAERAADTELGLGSDVMVTALQGYALLRVVGRSHGLESLRRDLGERFTKPSRAEQPQPEPEPEPQPAAA